MKRRKLEKSLLKRVGCLIVLLITVTSKMFAQQTTASIHGTVRDADGNAFESVNVQITNVNTGATYGTVTNRFGWYSVSGLRPGTYNAMFSFVGYRSAGVYNVSIKAAQDYVLDFNMVESTVDIDDVVILGKRYNFSETRTGQTYQIGSGMISRLPSTSRSLLDYARLSPYSGKDNSMAGRDGRTTSLTIDGAILNNSMGLSADLPAGGSTISVDAVQEMQVAIAPFDVRQSDFTGGGINVITKSGTNDFKASAYTYFHNQNLRGNRISGSSLGKREKESESTYGITLGGPIVKNRLFYFVNLERSTSPGPLTEWKLSEDGTGNSQEMTSRVTAQDMNDFAQALSVYGYNPGSTTMPDGGESNDKLLVRLDWTISDRHNLMLRYNLTENSQNCLPNARSTVGTRMASERVSEMAYAFSRNCYTINDKAWSGVAELNSMFGKSGQVSNKLLATISKVSNVRESDSQWFPHIDIMKDGDAFMSAGYELFSNGTGNNVTTFAASDHLSMTFLHSTIVAGASYQYQKAKTNYRMYGTGYYRYASLDDFLNQARPVAFGYTYTYNDTNEPESKATYSTWAAFVQAETRITNLFTATYGLRADVIEYLDPVRTNQAYKSIDWTGHFMPAGMETDGYRAPVLDTGAWPAVNAQFSPRLGFNWDIAGNSKLVLHGGSGLFRGRVPMVFLTCISNSSGLLQNTVTATGNSGYLDGLQGNFLYTEQALMDYVADKGAIMSAGNGSISNGASITAIDSKFRMPSVWKSSVALDLKTNFPFPIKAGIEAIFNKDYNAVYTENWNQESLKSLTCFYGNDTRYNFHNAATVSDKVSKTGGAMVIRNTNKGYGWSACLSFAATPIKNLEMEMAYTHTQAYSVSDMLGSSLSSTWSNVPNVNSPNEATLKPSSYVTPNRVIASVLYTFNSNRTSGVFRETQLGLFYSGQNSGTYSYLYSNDMNGDGVSNDLMWIPKYKNELILVPITDSKTGQVLFSAQEQQEAFVAFISQDRYLSTHIGEYAKANSALMPWYNRFDLRISQNLALPQSSQQNLRVSMDIMNAGNLLCSSWGVPQTASASNNGRILEYAGTSGGYPTYRMCMNSGKLISHSFEKQKSLSNCWYIQLGVQLSL